MITIVSPEFERRHNGEYRVGDRRHDSDRRGMQA
jgi:hypothetical protein